MSEQIGSHTEETQDMQQAIAEHRVAFGLAEEEILEEHQEDIEEESAEKDKGNDPQNEEPPATEEPKKITVKFNKQDVEVDVSDDKIPEYVQKALALDKERERKSELEKALDRAAKLAGYESREALLENLDELEKAAKQREKDQFESLKKQLREDAEAAGLDPEKVEQYIENHPLLKQANQAISKLEQWEQESKQAEELSLLEKKWEQLFQKYPDLVNTPEDQWLIPDMEDRLKRGYDPIDAYELAHRDKLVTDVKKQAEQAAIKQQMLNKRAQIETPKDAEPEPEVPEELASAFSLFGLPVKAARKYVKK